MILQIERRWNREPGWFATLAPDVRLSLLADFRMDFETDKTRSAKSHAAKRARFDMIMTKRRNQGAI